jgi:all-trans-retinol dehydrogenase (NAD+)
VREFKNKKFLVTGAASGLGLGLAKTLAARGCDLILLDLNLNGLNELVRELRMAHPQQQFFLYEQDLAKTEELPDLRERIRRDVGPIDGLINNAGVVYGGPFQEVSLEKHLLTFDLNVKSLVTLTHLFFDDLTGREDSHLVNISSASGLLPLPFGVSYASSKWAVLGFSDSLRVEMNLLKKKNPQITTVCPSYFASGMFSGVKAPFLTPILTTEKIVNLIITGIEKNKNFVLAPPIVHAIEPLKGLLPRFIFDRVAHLLGVTTSMTRWRGRS